MFDQMGFNFFSDQPTQRQLSDDILAEYNKKITHQEESKRWGVRLSMAVDGNHVQAQSVYLLRSTLYQLDKALQQRAPLSVKANFCQILSLEAGFKRGHIDSVCAVRQGILSLQKRP